MKTELSKKLIAYSLVTVMLVTHSASAAGFNIFGSKEAEISVPVSHPCASILQMELGQIKIMESTKTAIDRDSTLRSAGNTAGAASAGQDAVSAALSGDVAGAVINSIGAAIFGAKAIKEGKAGIKNHFTLAEGIDARKKNLKYVLANPQVCNETVRKAYLVGYIQETKINNDNFTLVLDAAINKIEGKITPVQNAVALGAGVALAIGTVVAFKSKAHPLAWLVLGAGATLGIGTGAVGYIKDYGYNIPLLSDLKAQKSQLETFSAQLQGQLAQLQASN